MHVEMVTGALAGTGRGAREERSATVALGASPLRVFRTLPARHSRREGRPGVGNGRHTSANTRGRPPGPPEDATHALPQAPTRT